MLYVSGTGDVEPLPSITTYQSFRLEANGEIVTIYDPGGGRVSAVEGMEEALERVDSYVRLEKLVRAFVES